MREEVLLKYVKSENNVLIKDWDYEGVNKDIRCYYKRIEYDKPNEKVGFDFVIVAVIGWQNDKDGFDLDNDVEILYEGVAYFDGIRHLYMGSKQTENYGYHYYPSLKDNIASLTVLRELEEKFCRDLD